MAMVLRAIRDLLSKDPELAKLAHSCEEIAKPFDKSDPEPAPKVDSKAFKESSARVQKAFTLYKQMEQNSIAVAKKVESAKAELDKANQQMAESEVKLQEARAGHSAEIGRHLAAFPKGCPVDDPQPQAEQAPAEQAPESASASSGAGAAGSQDVDALRAKAHSLKQALDEHEAALDSALKKRRTNDEDAKKDIESTADDAAMAPAEQVG
jgi:hypothetical protein